jgi:hypothetical protein
VRADAAVYSRNGRKTRRIGCRRLRSGADREPAGKGAAGKPARARQPGGETLRKMIFSVFFADFKMFSIFFPGPCRPLPGCRGTGFLRSRMPGGSAAGVMRLMPGRQAESCGTVDRFSPSAGHGERVSAQNRKDVPAVFLKRSAAGKFRRYFPEGSSCRVWPRPKSRLRAAPQPTRPGSSAAGSPRREAAIASPARPRRPRAACEARCPHRQGSSAGRDRSGQGGRRRRVPRKRGRERRRRGR